MMQTPPKIDSHVAKHKVCKKQKKNQDAKFNNCHGLGKKLHFSPFGSLSLSLKFLFNHTAVLHVDRKITMIHFYFLHGRNTENHRSVGVEHI